MTVIEHPTPADYAAEYNKYIMAARSTTSTRRSTLRGGRDRDVSPVTDRSQENDILPLRSKRPRVAPISDRERLKKKLKVDKTSQQPRQLRIPLRNRHPDVPAPVPSPPRSIDTDPVLHTSRKLPHLKPKALEIPSSVDVSTEESTPRNEYDALLRDEKKAKKAALASQGQSEKRSLRSHDGRSRFKSELAQYFQNYERMISLDSTEPELITPKTIVTFIDDIRDPSQHAKYDIKPGKGRPRTAFNSIPLHNAQRVDLKSIAQPPRRSLKDPLHSEIYVKAHRRPERQEKQLRNIEKERAQHEKVQLDRLLEELRGPDWLKVMGITGITESEKKLYEPKRIYFIREVAALIEKFKQWKEEEKRRKVERDQALLEQMEEEARGGYSGSDQTPGSDEEEGVEDDSGDDASSEGSEEEEEIADSQADNTSVDHEIGDEERPTQSSPTNSSDVDAQAARQLLIEASSASLPPPPKVKRSGHRKAPQETSPTRYSKNRKSRKQGPTPPNPDRTRMFTKPIHTFFHRSQAPALRFPPSHSSSTPHAESATTTRQPRRIMRSKRAPSTATSPSASPPPPPSPPLSRSKQQAKQALKELVPTDTESRDYGLPKDILTQKRIEERRRRSRRLRRERSRSGEE